jgi:hypothetical protein
MAKNTTLILLFLIYSISCFNITEEVVSREELQWRVNRFNRWLNTINLVKNNKLEIKINANNEIGVYATEDIEEDEVIAEIDQDYELQAEGVQTTFINQFIKELEEKWGYDDFVNILFYALHEIKNPNSKIKPFLDLLPRRPNNLAFDYWGRSKKFEDEFENMNIMSKIKKFIVRKGCRIQI